MKTSVAMLMALAPLLPSVACSSGDSEALRVFAAASLVDVFATLEQTFEGENPGVDVVIQPGGSTQLATQIVEGAPADVFAAASEAAMSLVTDSPVPVFASNRLVIATPPDNPGGIEGLADLERSDLVVAVCAEEVPCGDLARQVLEDAGLEISADTEEPNVRAVLNKVVLDEVDAGLVYQSDAVSAGSAVLQVPIDSDRANDYPITALTDSDVARRFVDLVLSESSAEILENAGFDAP